MLKLQLSVGIKLLYECRRESETTLFLECHISDYFMSWWADLVGGVRDPVHPGLWEDLAVAGAVEVQDGVHDDSTLELRPSPILHTNRIDKDEI